MSSKPGQRIGKYLGVAVLCALPFLLGSLYLCRLAEQVDTLPLDLYEGLRWTPGGEELAFLHRPLRQSPPPETELWRVGATLSEFRQVGKLASEYQWTLTKRHVDPWMLLKAQDSEGTVKLALADGAGEVKFLETDEGWTLLPSQGDGLYFQSIDDALPFDQFVEVEDAPEMKPDTQPQGDLPVNSPPTRSGLKIAGFNPQTNALEPLLSIPYSRPEEKPLVELVRRSPDKRFLALVVRFGETGSPGLWIYDGQNQKLLWTRVVVSAPVQGLDWSSDSVKVAITDSHGVSILEKALGIESVRLEVSTSGGLRPKWGPGSKLYLVNDHIVYLVEQEKGQAEPLFDSEAQVQGYPDLVLDPLNGKVAYSSSPNGYRELSVRDLESGQTLAQESFPGSLKQKAQGTMAYQIGAALRFAWNRWTGRG